MGKSADAFRTISEVAEWLETPAHVLRFWESKFTQIKPVKRAGGRRYYRPADMTLIGGIKKLLHDDGMTIKGAQKVLREQGVKYVSSLSQPLAEDLADPLEATQAAEPAPTEADKSPQAGLPDDATVVAFRAGADPSEGAPDPRGAKDVIAALDDEGDDAEDDTDPDAGPGAGPDAGAVDEAVPLTGGKDTAEVPETRQAGPVEVPSADAPAMVPEARSPAPSAPQPPPPEADAVLPEATPADTRVEVDEPGVEAAKAGGTDAAEGTGITDDAAKTRSPGPDQTAQAEADAPFLPAFLKRPAPGAGPPDETKDPGQPGEEPAATPRSDTDEADRRDDAPANASFKHAGRDPEARRDPEPDTSEGATAPSGTDSEPDTSAEPEPAKPGQQSAPGDAAETGTAPPAADEIPLPEQPAEPDPEPAPPAPLGRNIPPDPDAAELPDPAPGLLARLAAHPRLARGSRDEARALLERLHKLAGADDGPGDAS